MGGIQEMSTEAQQQVLANAAWDRRVPTPKDPGIGHLSPSCDCGVHRHALRHLWIAVITAETRLRKRSEIFAVFTAPVHGWDSGQKWRPGSGRWANSRGRKAKMFELWKKEHKNPFFHRKRFFQTKNTNGDWSFIDSGLGDAEAWATEPVIAS